MMEQGGLVLDGREGSFQEIRQQASWRPRYWPVKVTVPEMVYPREDEFLLISYALPISSYP